MTTSTLDQTDLDHWLDGTPRCESPVGCDRAAVYRMWWRCSCRPALSCTDCAAGIVAYFVRSLMRGVAIQLCLSCGVTMRGRFISDFVEVRPL